MTSTFRVERLIDHALKILIIRLVIFASRVSDTIEEITANSFTFAINIVLAHAWSHIVVVLVDIALVVRLRVRVCFIVFLLFFFVFLAVRFTMTPAPLRAISVSSAVIIRRTCVCSTRIF